VKLLIIITYIRQTMGAAVSKITTECEEPPYPKMTEEEMQLQKVHEMPKYARVESFEQKLYRKFSEEPLVPIGCVTTAFFLGSGIKSFYNRDAIRSQKMMRARVGAQFATLLVLAGYAGMSALNFNIAPGYQTKERFNDEESSA